MRELLGVVLDRLIDDTRLNTVKRRDITIQQHLLSGNWH